MFQKCTLMINLETDIILGMSSAAIGVRPICPFGFYNKNQRKGKQTLRMHGIRCRNTGRALGIRDMLTDTIYHAVHTA